MAYGSRPGTPPVCLRILGLTPPSTEAEVRAAYRRKARELHPDVGGDAAAFVLLNAAYEEALALVSRPPVYTRPADPPGQSAPSPPPRPPPPPPPQRPRPTSSEETPAGSQRPSGAASGPRPNAPSPGVPVRRSVREDLLYLLSFGGWVDSDAKLLAAGLVWPVLLIVTSLFYVEVFAPLLQPWSAARPAAPLATRTAIPMSSYPAPLPIVPNRAFATATRVAIPPAAYATSTRAGWAALPLFRDDFSNPSSGWPVESANRGSQQIGYRSGEYQVIKPAGSGQTAAAWHLRSFRDFRLAIYTTLTEPARGAYVHLGFRGQDNGDGYALLVDPDSSRLVLRRFTGNLVLTLYDRSGLPILKSPLWNHIVVRAKGPDIALIVNGVEHGRVRDDGLREGRFALGVGSWTDGLAEARFGGLIVTDVE
jgi:hypothetical protein